MVGVKIARNEVRGWVCWVERNRRDAVCNADSRLRDSIVKGLNKLRKKFRPAEKASAAKWKADWRRTPLEERWPTESFSCQVSSGSCPGDGEKRGNSRAYRDAVNSSATDLLGGWMENTGKNQLIQGTYSQHIITKHVENSWSSVVNTTEMLLLLLAVIYQHCYLQTIFISTNYSRPNGETHHQESRSVLHFFLSMNITDR